MPHQPTADVNHRIRVCVLENTRNADEIERCLAIFGASQPAVCRSNPCAPALRRGILRVVSWKIPDLTGSNGREETDPLGVESLDPERGGRNCCLAPFNLGFLLCD